MMEPLPDTVYTIPRLYGEGYFSGDSLLHPELAVRPAGLYSPHVVLPFRREDEVILPFLLMVGLIGFLIRFRGRDILSRIRFLPVVFSSLSFAGLAVFLIPYFMPQLIPSPSYGMWGILAVLVVMMWVFRNVLYGGVNWIFFDFGKKEEWRKIYTKLFLFEAFCYLFLLAVALFVPLSPKVMVGGVVLAMIYPKIMLLYHGKRIFFPEIYGILQIIVYLCALELLPLLICWYIFVQMSGSCV